MHGFNNRLAIIIPTKDRPAELAQSLKGLSGQSVLPLQIVIVDGGESPVLEILTGFSGLNMTYLRSRPATASGQRNKGLKAVDAGIDFVGFLDDDVKLPENAIEAMMDFWKDAADSVGGAAFNLVNIPRHTKVRFESSSFAERLGLYSAKPGELLSSGFHTMIDRVDRLRHVRWLPGGASVWRKAALGNDPFDERLGAYSYLEDIDLSYRVGKEFEFFVIPEAKYYHHEASNSRINRYRYGQKVVVNRLYFVRKHKEFSLWKCYIALLVRFGITLARALRRRNAEEFQLALGNVIGFAKSFILSKDEIRNLG